MWTYKFWGIKIFTIRCICPDLPTIKIFDVYEGENIPEDKKSIALKVTIQSNSKTLNDSDLTRITDKIVKSVEEKTGAKLRS